MHFFPLAVVGALITQAAAAPLLANHVVHERRANVPKAWVKRERLDATITVPVRIGMTQRNLEKGHDLLMEV